MNNINSYLLLSLRKLTTKVGRIYLITYRVQYSRRRRHLQFEECEMYSIVGFWDNGQYTVKTYTFIKEMSVKSMIIILSEIVQAVVNFYITQNLSTADLIEIQLFTAYITAFVVISGNMRWRMLIIWPIYFRGNWSKRSNVWYLGRHC